MYGIKIQKHRKFQANRLETRKVIGQKLVLENDFLIWAKYKSNGISVQNLACNCPIYCILLSDVAKMMYSRWKLAA